MNQENLALKNEITELKNQISISNGKIDQLQHFCSCLIPYIGVQWPDFREYTQKTTSDQVDKIISNPNNLMLRHNQLEQEVLTLKNRMENLVDVRKTATGCDIPSASQRFIHQQTPMNPYKGLSQQNLGDPRPNGMDIEHDSNPYPL